MRPSDADYSIGNLLWQVVFHKGPAAPLGHPPQGSMSYGAGSISHGLTNEEIARISKCRCEPLERPVFPIAPIRSPWPTLCPQPTLIPLRWAYNDWKSLPWSTMIMLP